MLWFSPRGYYCRDDDPHYCARQGFFIYCLSCLVFTILAFNYLYLVWVSLSTTIGLLVVQPLSLTCAGCSTPPSPDKEDYFVSLLTGVFLSTTMWVFPLPIPHGMHLVVPTHPYFFWAICHPSRTFSLKELEKEPQNRLSSLPTTRPYPFLPLTHDPPLPVLAGYRLVMFGPCACTTSVYVQNLSTAYAFAMV